MRKYVMILSVLVLVQSLSYAFPVIENINVIPQSMWIGQSPVVTFNCYDDNKTTTAYVNTIGPSYIFMPLIPPLLDLKNGTFIGDYNQFKTAYLNKNGNYDIILFCNNSDGENNSTSTVFTISKLTGHISYVDSNVYVGDSLDINFIVKKDETNLLWYDNVSFAVTLNNTVYPLEIQPAYNLSSNEWMLKIKPPSAGNFNLTVYAYYNGTNASDTTTISIRSNVDSGIYNVNVNGKIVDNNNKGISTQIKFFSGNVEKLRFSTDSSGHYSNSLPPGTYDVQIAFPQSTLYLDYVSINNFNDPIRYFYSTEQLVSGIRSAGLFGYEVALNYDEVNIEMNYDEKNLFDETKLVIFRCSNWNSGRKACNDNWSEVYGEYDTVRNLAKLNLTSLSAFVVGERKAINVNFNLDSERYYTGSTVRVRGLVKDSDGDSVANATIKANVKNTEIKVNTSSDNNGVFSIEFKAPENEGNYTLVLSAEESPYISFSSSKNFDVIISRTIEILIPDTIKLKQGQSFTQEVSIVNTGQANLLNLNISLTGIPTNYFNLTNFIGRLNENEENKIFIYFTIPENAEKKTYGATLEVSNSEIKQERVFGFTVVDKNETIDIQSTPAGRFILPKLDSNSVYIIVFAVAVFSIAIFLKKMKIKKSKRNDVKDFLSDVKDSLRYRKTEMTTNLKNVSDYRDLIKSEFPNAFKNKDKYGKNN